MAQSQAIDYALLTVVLSKDGNDQEKKGAEETIFAAINWEIFGELDFMEKLMLKAETRVIVRRHLFPSAHAKPAATNIFDRFAQYFRKFK